MRFPLARRVSRRLLLRPAVVTALLRIGLEVFSSVYFSSSVISDSRLYGTIGVVFSLMVWFIAVMVLPFEGHPWRMMSSGMSRCDHDRVDRLAQGASAAWMGYGLLLSERSRPGGASERFRAEGVLR
jgi:hypothetical protein